MIERESHIIIDGPPPMHVIYSVCHETTILYCFFPPVHTDFRLYCHLAIARRASSYLSSISLRIFISTNNEAFSPLWLSSSEPVVLIMHIYLTALPLGARDGNK